MEKKLLIYAIINIDFHSEIKSLWIFTIKYKCEKN